MIPQATERLWFRRLDRADASFLVNLLNQASFLRYIGDKGVRDDRDAMQYMEGGPWACEKENGFSLWACVLRESNQPVGICGLLRRQELPVPDLGFACLEAFHRHGYMLEAARACLAMADSREELRVLAAICDEHNRASINLLQRLGFQESATVTSILNEQGVMGWLRSQP